MVFAGWLFERSSSGSGNGRLVLGWLSSSGDSRLVLAMVVWFWQRSSTGCRSGASLGREDVRKEGRVKNKVVFRCTRGMQRHYREYSGDPIVLGTIWMIRKIKVVLRACYEPATSLLRACYEPAISLPGGL